MKALFDTVAGIHPTINYEQEMALWDFIIDTNEKGLLQSAKDVNVGGVAIALSKMAAVSALGCQVDIDVAHSRDIFSESMSVAIVEVKPDDCEAFEAVKSTLNVQKIGLVIDNEVKCNTISISIEALQQSYFSRFKEVIEQDL